MADVRWWAIMVCFERQQEGDNVILPVWAWGACGWMLAQAPDVAEARRRLVCDLGKLSLVVVELDDEQEVFDSHDVAGLDEQLAANFSTLEPGKQTVWGTIHGYKGEGAA